MRLAQAARKLSITTDDIVDFLEIRGVSIEKDSNTKLDEEAVELLYKYFEIEEEGKVEIEEIEEDESVDQEEDSLKELSAAKSLNLESDQVEDKVADEEETAAPAEKDIQATEGKEESIKRSFKTVDELLEGDDDHSSTDFIIKAPKVELKGLNVVGKIDLPEPKQKSEPEEKKEVDRRTKKSTANTRPRRPLKRKQKRELSPAEIRKRQEEKDARKLERIKKERKKKREEFYKEKVLKPKQIEQKNKPKKKKSAAVGKMVEQKPKPKTVLGKFWRWLNT